MLRGHNCGDMFRNCHEEKNSLFKSQKPSGRGKPRANYVCRRLGLSMGKTNRSTTIGIYDITLATLHLYSPSSFGAFGFAPVLHCGLIIFLSDLGLEGETYPRFAGKGTPCRTPMHKQTLFQISVSLIQA